MIVCYTRDHSNNRLCLKLQGGTLAHHKAAGKSNVEETRAVADCILILFSRKIFNSMDSLRAAQKQIF